MQRKNDRAGSQSLFVRRVTFIRRLSAAVAAAAAAAGLADSAAAKHESAAAAGISRMQCLSAADRYWYRPVPHGSARLSLC